MQQQASSLEGTLQRAQSFAALLTALLAAIPGILQAAGTNDPGLWATHIQPLLSQNCFKCHGELKQKSGLDLSTPTTILKGGERGAAIVPGKPAESLLFQFIQAGADPHMPPKEHQLTEDEIALVKRWISSFSAPSSPSLPPGERGGVRGSWESAEESWVRPNLPAKQPRENVSGSAAIDFYVRAGWAAAKVNPTQPADDATFARRVYLDLIGRIPTIDELSAFLRDHKKAKRAALVDHLLASPEFAQNMAETFNVLLTAKRSNDESWKDYLRYAFSSNRPWDQIARDLLLARPSSKELRGAVYFLLCRTNNHQAMAEAIATVFFGVQVNCAQCHNHPLAPEIKQKHYWGMVAFLNRSKNVETPDGPALGESAIGGFVKFANLKKESQEALLTFISNKTVTEARPGENEKEEDSAEKYSVPPDKKAAAVPKFSRRERFAELATRENPLLARTFVNRAWAMLMGRGLVQPADRMDSSHPPSNPDLLAWLAADFEQSGYDIRRLLHNICLSEAYQLESKWSGRTKPEPELFAYAFEKPLRAEVLLRSMGVAAGVFSPSPLNGERAGVRGEAVRQAHLSAGPELKGLDAFQPLFADRFPEVLSAEAMPNLRQALFFSNNAKFDGLFVRHSRNTVDELLKVPHVRDRVDQAFVRVFARQPDREERKHAIEFLSSKLRDPERRLQEFLWALFTSAEFRFNH